MSEKDLAMFSCQGKEACHENCGVGAIRRKGESRFIDVSVMDSGDSWKPAIARIEQKLGYRFQRSELLIEAFTHASLINETRTAGHSNQRLEFLGDALLGAIVAEHLFLALPQLDEGEMTRARAEVVSRRACAEFSANLDIASFLRVGKGERRERTQAMLADLFEAIVGAIFLDGGYLAAKRFLTDRCLKENVPGESAQPAADFKSQLQILSQRRYREIPHYTLLAVEGPSHRQTFSASVAIGGRVLAEGEGQSRQSAEQRAAQSALAQFDGNPQR